MEFKDIRKENEKLHASNKTLIDDVRLRNLNFVVWFSKQENVEIIVTATNRSWRL